METENQTIPDLNSTNSSVPFTYQFTSNGIIYYTDPNGCWYTVTEPNFAGIYGNFVMEFRQDNGLGVREAETEAADSDGFDVATDGGFRSKEATVTEVAAPMNNSYLDLNGPMSNVAVDGDFLPLAPDNEITASPTPIYNHIGKANHMSYAELITKAIDSSVEKRMTLSDIYDWMVANVVEFKDQRSASSTHGWKNSIRHTLSLNKRFKSVTRDGMVKPSWWTITEEVDGERNDLQSKSTTRPRANTITSAIIPRAKTTMTTRQRANSICAIDMSSNVAPPFQWEPANEITVPTTTIAMSHTPKAKYLPYVELITKAINSSPEKRMILGEIYDWMEANVAECKGQRYVTCGWKNSVRHYLSLNKRFQRVKRNGLEKPSWWTLTDQVGSDRIKVQTKSSPRVPLN